MRMYQLEREDDFESWRVGARAALREGIKPANVYFQIVGEIGNLFGDCHPPYPIVNEVKNRAADGSPITVPPAFMDLARQVICHSDPERFTLLYRLLRRLQVDKQFLKRSAHEIVHRNMALAKEVRRDLHKMKAFVRFRKTGEIGGIEQFVAWFEPSHHIVRYNAPFFMRRFANMHWSILTPKGCAHWDTKEISFSEAVPKSQAPSEDALEDYWKSYYASIFNPARLKVDAMTSEMPKKYWKNLPEADLIPELVAKARDREAMMRHAEPTQPRETMMAHIANSAEEAFPAREAIANIGDLHEALKGCRACPLWKPATQAVAGRGPSDADIMFVGEQPGDREDLAGEPFVGPAGQVLRDVMADIGQPMDRVYLTNAVKHFKFVPRGKRRLHQNPSAGEIDHCKWWLGREIELVRPKVIVALGGSAVRALTGKTQSVKSLRGAPLPLANGASMIVANHPSYILRLKDEAAQANARAVLSEDLQNAFGHLD